ncbi:type VII secretion target [Mycolicibacterium mageritense]|uniref:ESX-1 secretion-associated protein n=1 Tax=Mycolicibacterium mageritense TaxID=53462 RepID=A0AAI8U271_MYCME|nr:type VII secretion target [Mycolicibacterium mageritense]BDY33139.1 hypothetical protein hbim_07114 [Mycolicibacterium mageritense]
MADDLSVDTAGLRTGAARHGEVAEAIATTHGDTAAAGSQPSHAGVAAIRAAVASARAAQSGRVAQLGTGLSAANAVYIHADDDAADNITRTV